MSLIEAAQGVRDVYTPAQLIANPQAVYDELLARRASSPRRWWPLAPSSCIRLAEADRSPPLTRRLHPGVPI